MTTEMGGNEWNGNPGAEVPLNQWVHLAGTYDGTSMKMYMNGVLIEEQQKSGPIDWEFKPLELRIGSYIDDNELYYWDGFVDEVRIWDIARTQEDIRQTMCVPLQGDEAGLVAYYKLDELSGSDVFDASINGLDGAMGNSMIPAQDRQISGAGIGNESVYVYPENWDTQSLALAGTNQGTITVDSVMGNAQGVQIYRVDGGPAFTEGITPLDTTGSYFGVVIAGGAGATYDATIDYTDHPEAVADESNLIMGVRRNSAGRIWTNIVAELDTAINTLEKNGIAQRREFILATTAGATCDFPSAVQLDSATFSTIDISWISAAGASNVEYGPAGFSLGNGTLVEGTGNTLNVVDLATAETIDVYLQDVCDSTSISSWVGPFSFTSEICNLPTELMATAADINAIEFSWTESSNATAYNIEWGPIGTELGLGIGIDSVANGYVLENLPLDSIQFYVQSVCGEAGDSEWVGPMLATVVTSTNQAIPTFANLKVFPNPTTGFLNVTFESLTAQDAQLQITNMWGQNVHREMMTLAGNRYNVATSVDLSGVAAGQYVVRLVGKDFSMVRKISVQ